MSTKPINVIAINGPAIGCAIVFSDSVDGLCKTLHVSKGPSLRDYQYIPPDARETTYTRQAQYRLTEVKIGENSTFVAIEDDGEPLTDALYRSLFTFQDMRLALQNTTFSNVISSIAPSLHMKFTGVSADD